MELPSNNEDYKDQSYWDKRYEDEETFDWFSKYSAFKHLVQKTIAVENSILMLGCGNSVLSEDMYKAGYKHITNVDYSPVVISNMAQRCKHMPSMKWEVMDITDLKYEDESFDIVLEKGTLDAMLVTETNPWKFSEEGSALMGQILQHVSRVLKPSGKFISVTFAQPHFRQLVYAKPEYDWDFQTSTFGSFFHFFYYVMRKGHPLSPNILEANERYKAISLHSPNNCDTAEIEFVDDSEDFLMDINL